MQNKKRSPSLNENSDSADRLWFEKMVTLVYYRRYCWFREYANDKRYCNQFESRSQNSTSRLSIGFLSTINFLVETYK